MDVASIIASLDTRPFVSPPVLHTARAKLVALRVVWSSTVQFRGASGLDIVHTVHVITRQN